MGQPFGRWKDKEVRRKILEIIMLEPDCEWIMIDATYCKCHHVRQAHANASICARIEDAIAKNFRSCEEKRNGICYSPRESRKFQRYYDKNLYKARQRHE